MLPKGLQFQSKPTPGEAPQLFELATDTAIAAPDQLPATPPPVLLGQVADAADLAAAASSGRSRPGDPIS